MNCQVSHQRGRVVVRMAALVGMGDQNIDLDPTEQFGKATSQSIGAEDRLLIHSAQPIDLAVG